jgi:hypothetical protein
MLKITEKYAIDFDDYNVICLKRRTHGEKSKTPGLEDWRAFAYYPKVENGGFRHALDRIAKEKVLIPGDLVGIAYALESMQQTVKDLCAKLDPEKVRAALNGEA